MRLRVESGAAGDRLAVGTGPGRGAWLCHGVDCLEVAVARGSLSRALRRPVLPDGLDEVRGRLARGPVAGRGPAGS